MDDTAVLDISREAIFLLIKTSAPLLLVALVVGLAISLVQALTQIQEMTLSFVPKIVSIFLASLVVVPFIFHELELFTNHISDIIIGQANSDQNDDVNE
ncbi:MAG: flagellar biosynthesis protein FliQ [Alphaproteobacteria bacterium]|nr:flagellar biosynthesis protein FliQ [Alphaproteobacteria bacterium]